MTIDESLPTPPCPVCQAPIIEEGRWGRNVTQCIDYFPCRTCGYFRLRWKDQGLLADRLGKDPNTRGIVSHGIRRLRRKQDEQPPLLTMELVERMLEQGLPSPPEQVVNLLLWLGEQTEPGHGKEISAYDGAVIGCRDADGFWWLVEHLKDAGLIEAGDVMGSDATKDLTGRSIIESLQPVTVCLTFKGWERYAELVRSVVDTRLAFMAMPFGHKDLDEVFHNYFKLAVEQTGFKLRRIDDNPPAGSIDNRLRVEIRRARFAVVDLTYDNSGAYWEAGFAEGLGRPVFYTCRKDRKDEDVHFDTRQQHIVFWTPDDLHDAANRLKATIRVTIPDARLEDS